MEKLLIVVDYQVDFVTGSLGFPEAKNLEGPIVRLIRTYEDKGDEVVFTKDVHVGRLYPDSACRRRQTRPPRGRLQWHRQLTYRHLAGLRCRDGHLIPIKVFGGA